MNLEPWGINLPINKPQLAYNYLEIRRNKKFWRKSVQTLTMHKMYHPSAGILKL